MVLLCQMSKHVWRLTFLVQEFLLQMCIHGILCSWRNKKTVNILYPTFYTSRIALQMFVLEVYRMWTDLCVCVCCSFLFFWTQKTLVLLIILCKLISDMGWIKCIISELLFCLYNCSLWPFSWFWYVCPSALLGCIFRANFRVLDVGFLFFLFKERHSKVKNEDAETEHKKNCSQSQWMNFVRFRFWYSQFWFLGCDTVDSSVTLVVNTCTGSCRKWG